ncbi:MAG TPA: phasin family protein [Burkholderiales bacterium]|nr:phasin family protein [Burkholderiales bacterium]
MVKKLKRLAEGASDNQLAATVRDSAQQIWLAGLGAFGKAQAEGAKVFDALVKEGKNLEGRTRKFAQMRMGSVTGTVEKAATKATARATATWDKLEQVFEDRVARALHKLGVPTNRDIQNLSKRVEELTASVRKLDSGRTKAARAKRAVRK